jgi:hypothetical protein
VRTGEGPLLVTEELALQHAGREGAAVDRHERRAHALAPVVQQLRDDLFPRAGRARDQHRRLRRSRARNELEHRAALLALGDDAVRRKRGPNRLAQVRVFAREARVLDRPSHQRAQLVVVERLRQVVKGAVDQRTRGALVAAPIAHVADEIGERGERRGEVALHVYACEKEGIAGFFAFLRNLTPWGMVLAADLVIALGLSAVWMVGDAKPAGKNAWPFVGLTAALGSIGALAYLVRRQERGALRG